MPTLTNAGCLLPMEKGVQQQIDSSRTLVNFAAWVLLLLTCIFAYWPGLNGPFVFDDFGTITTLGDLGGVRDWATFKAFVLGGHTGPTGRPLSLLSFLVDANNWPADPWPFKRTNLVIHLINGVLLGGLISRILGLLEFDRPIVRRVAWLSAACWLLHPFLVSTTLYVVQRMAQLSTLFVFSGLLLYLTFRAKILIRPMMAYAGMSVSVVLFTFLAMISKENGILLPLLIAVVEITVVASRRDQIAGLNRYWNALFILAPVAIITLYLGEKFFRPGFFAVVPPRDFSVYERLLTEPRVLADYLRHWFVPDLYTSGVFQDHFIKSTGFWSPITSALSAALHLAMISIALIFRRRWPLFALAVLFFYASHVLESSVINLELYFEHRNYLAGAFLFLPVVALLQKHSSDPGFYALAAVIVVAFAGFTRYSATIWESYPAMVVAAASKAPTSSRAQTQLAAQLYNEKRYGEALQVIDKTIELRPNDALLQISRSSMLCGIGILTAHDFERAAGLVSSRSFDPRAISLYTTLTTAIADKQCPDVQLFALRAMFVNMLQVPANADTRALRYSQIQYFIGLVDVRAGDPANAIVAFDKSLQSRPGAEHAMAMAALLATHDYFDEALYLSEKALANLRAYEPGALQAGRVLESDILDFQANIRAEIAGGGRN